MCRLQSSFELTAQFFTQKLPKSHVQKFQNKIKGLMEQEIQSGSEPSAVVTDLYKLCEGIIEYFREAKSDILKVCTQMDLFDDLDIGFVSLDYPVSKDTLQLELDNFIDLIENLQEKVNDYGEGKKGFVPIDISEEKIKLKFENYSDIVSGTDRTISVDNVLFSMFDFGIFLSYESLGKEEPTNNRRDIAIKIDILPTLESKKSITSPKNISPKRGSVMITSPKIQFQNDNARASFAAINL